MTTEEILRALPERNIITFSAGFRPFAEKFIAYQTRLLQIGEDAINGPLTVAEGAAELKAILPPLKADMEAAGEWLESELPVLSDPAAYVGADRAERESNARNALEFLQGHRAFAAIIQKDFGDEPELSNHFMTMLDYAINRTQRQIRAISEATD